mmetsp:Transcript_38046/g.45907  ORF Transcript_38046/g.45907 Transcript_38046/m.45907 type:complete len:88 (-) Transcript_38046:1036-1299(-)|eukprot:CAMPEP_0197848216 /NCGR_PEP_ID=MMETSP1438-20131217/7988_1 /TAXON_ID=1461541 /ORGANISM="Pterosperma sp., Strain CCMP1384" /LENGTH=87 /DNA_ID=CAMNT_0043460359 /DNA_START=211 /DNA_END=474 /DNA_ORIENTATION=+
MATQAANSANGDVPLPIFKKQVVVPEPKPPPKVHVNGEHTARVNALLASNLHSGLFYTSSFMHVEKPPEEEPEEDYGDDEEFADNDS